MGRILVGAGTTGLVEMAISFLLKHDDFLWIVGGWVMSIMAGVFAAKGVAEFNAKLVALGVFTVCSGIAGAIAAYRLSKNSHLFQRSKRKLLRRRLWGTRLRLRWVLPLVVGVAVLLLALKLASPSVPSFSHEISAAEGKWSFVSWLPGRDKIALVSDSRAEMYIVRADGTEARQLLSVGFESGIESPAWSPDGEQVAFTRKFSEWRGRTAFCEIATVEVNSGVTNRIATGFDPSWSPDGEQIAFVSGPAGEFGPTWSPTEDEKTAYGPSSGSDIHTMAANGGEARLVTVEDNYDKASSMLMDPAWSPDGRKIALVVQGIGKIWVVDVSTGTSRKLTGANGDDRLPVSSPDGRYIAFHREGWNYSSEQYDNDIYVMDSDGGNVRRLTYGDRHKDGLAWSRDGQKVLFHLADRGIYAVELTVVSLFFSVGLNSR